MKKNIIIASSVIALFVGFVWIGIDGRLYQGSMRRTSVDGDMVSMKRSNDKIIFQKTSDKKIVTFETDDNVNFQNFFDKKDDLSIKYSDFQIFLDKLYRENQDFDHDGLWPDQEKKYGTDPNKNDTDGDGVSDGEEVKRLLNPINPDSDYDGVNDGAELKLGTNPNDASSVWNPSKQTSDDDKDTLSNYFEDQQNFPPFLNKNVAEDIVLWNGEGKKGVHTFKINGQEYTGTYDFINCTGPYNSVLIVNFLDNSWNVSGINCVPKVGGGFVCEEAEWAKNLFKSLLKDGIHGVGAGNIWIKEKAVMGTTCNDKPFIYK